MNSNHIFHVIKDPVHGTMQFTSAEDAWVKPFIDSPHFQRLRHIKQLGLGDFIFPGAVHTRFNHCLGCSYVGSQITQKIGLAENERQLVMIACLLHDIGHGPFSHAFEGLFRNKYIRHEDWTPLFLSDFANEQFFKAYNHKNPRYPLTPEKFEIIAKMIMHQPTKKNVLADIVSSQLDADRLDYLLRDSHFCGVSYGEFDFRWMLHCMAIVQTEEGARLGITHKGIGTVEHYLMARRLMTRNIYHGQKKLALEIFLVEMLAKLAERIADHHAYETVANTRLGQFLIAVNHFNQKYDQAQHDENQLRALKARFLEQHFIEYQALCDYDVFMLIRALSAMDGCDEPIQIAKRLQSRIMPKIVRLDHHHLDQTLLQVQAFKSKHKDDFQDWQILLVETPHQSYSGDDDPIWVINETGRVKSLSDYSLMINAMANKLEHVAFLSIDQSIADDDRIIQFIQQL